MSYRIIRPQISLYPVEPLVPNAGAFKPPVKIFNLPLIVSPAFKNYIVDISTPASCSFVPAFIMVPVSVPDIEVAPFNLKYLASKFTPPS
jgi:hypothetical protein